MTAVDFASLLNEFSERFEIVARYEEQRDRELAPRFNVLRHMGENAVTEILRDLLDPHGDHGQEFAFLQRFLALSPLSIIVPAKALKDATVRTQVSTDKGRLLDLVIELPDGAYFGLENKIGAEEQRDQVKDYIEFIQKRSGQWRFLFLTPSGNSPGTGPENQSELIASRQLACLSYKEDVSKWLRSCASDCSAERVRSFLNDMANWAENLAQATGEEMDSGTCNTIKDLLSDNPERLKAALAIMDSGPNVKNLLLAAFAGEMKEALQNKYPEKEWSFWNDDGCDLVAALDKGDSGAWGAIRIRQNSWRPVDFSVGIAANAESHVPSNMLYGIHCPRPDEDLRRKLLGAKAIGGWREGPAWPLYKWVPPLGNIDARRWDNRDTILAMCDKATRTKLLEHFLKLFVDLEELASQVLGG
jgi:hypothetical protein